MDILNNYECYKECNIKKYNTYKLDVICKYLVFVKDTYELIELLKYLKDNNIKYLVLGNGSNVIFANSYYDGVIIKLDKMSSMEVKDNLVTVSCGYSLAKLSRDILEYNLVGLEFATGIPGLVGASIAMNAGAYNKDMSMVVREVTVLDKNLNVITLKNEDLDFSYRDSFLKKNKEYISLSGVLELEYGNKEDSLELIRHRREKRMETQPLDYPSAGSVFRNPEGMHAGELIEKCGLKGKNINGAEISKKHANFIINVGNPTGRDIIKLIDIAREKVLEKYGISLILEQEIIE